MRKKLICSLLLVAGISGAETNFEQAGGLAEEGKEFLRRARSPGGEVARDGQAAIAKFEQAQALLEKCGPEGGKLLEEVNALLFWTRRTTPLSFAPSSSAGKQPSPPQPEGTPRDEAPAQEAEAQKALAAAEKFAHEHRDNPRAVAARYFEVGTCYSGTEAANTACERARALQKHLEEVERAQQAKSDEKAALADKTLAEELALAAEGDRLREQKQFAAATAAYRRALAQKKSALLHRRLGHAYLEEGQAFHREYAQKYLEAYQRGDRAAAVRLGALAQKALDCYHSARLAFQEALGLSRNSDLDSDFHIALTYFYRRIKGPGHHRTAEEKFKTVVEKYRKPFEEGKLTGEHERTLYAESQTAMRTILKGTGLGNKE